MKALARATAAGRPLGSNSKASSKASMALSRIPKCRYNDPRSTKAVDLEFLCLRFSRPFTSFSAASKSSKASKVP